MQYSKISDFKSKVLADGGLLNNNHHFVLLTPPSALSGRGYDLEKCALLCEGLTLPGQNIATDDLRIYGENRVIPYMQLYEDVNMTFYVDGKMSIYSLFEDWMGLVFSKLTRAMGYPRDYLTDLTVLIHDRSGAPVRMIQLFECFPKSLSPVRMDYNSREILRMDVLMSVRYWISYPTTSEGTAIIPTPPGGFDTDSLLNNVYNTGMVPLLDIPSLGINQSIPSQPGVNQSFGLNSLINTGNQISTSIPQTANGVAAVTQSTSGLQSGVYNLANAVKSLTEPARGLGQGLIGLASTATNAIGAPINAVAMAGASFGATIGSINSTLAALGINTSLGNVQSKILTTSGKLGALSSLNGVPSNLTSLGANLTATGNLMDAATSQLAGMGSITTTISDAMKKFNSSLSSSGTALQESAVELQSEVDKGYGV
jgi:hypothetical protein